MNLNLFFMCGYVFSSFTFGACLSHIDYLISCKYSHSYCNQSDYCNCRLHKYSYIHDFLNSLCGGLMTIFPPIFLKKIYDYKNNLIKDF